MSGGGNRLSSYTAFLKGCKKLEICYNSDMLHHNYGGIFMKRKYAFTLAEVLITLGIIGIVAALTMPALIADYKKKEDAAKLKKAYTIINQAFKLSEVDNGPSEHWASAYDIGASAYYNQYWKPYFQGPSLCKKYQECGYTSHTPWKTLRGDTSGTVADMESASNSRVFFYTNDGILYGIFTSSGDMTAANSIIYIDINGGKKPNVYGRDLFRFTRVPGKGILPSGYSGTDEDINQNCSKTGSGEYCAAKIMRDGWEIKY